MQVYPFASFPPCTRWVSLNNLSSVWLDERITSPRCCNLISLDLNEVVCNLMLCVLWMWIIEIRPVFPAATYHKRIIQTCWSFSRWSEASWSASITASNTLKDQQKKSSGLSSVTLLLDTNKYSVYLFLYLLQFLSTSTILTFISTRVYRNENIITIKTVSHVRGKEQRIGYDMKRRRNLLSTHWQHSRLVHSITAAGNVKNNKCNTKRHLRKSHNVLQWRSSKVCREIKKRELFFFLSVIEISTLTHSFTHDVHYYFIHSLLSFVFRYTFTLDSSTTHLFLPLLPLTLYSPLPHSCFSLYIFFVTHATIFFNPPSLTRLFSLAILCFQGCEVASNSPLMKRLVNWKAP